MLIGSQLGFIAGQGPLQGIITQVGSGLSIPGDTYAMCALSSSRIALTYNSSGIRLATYDWSGSAWSLVGTALTGLSVQHKSVAFLSATRVATVYYDNPNNRIRLKAYDFNGSTWSAVGNELTINSSDPSAVICSLGVNQIALIRDVQSTTNAAISTYTFDGTNFSIVGSELTITAGAPNPPSSLQPISSTRVLAVLNFTTINDAIVYSFNGSTWSAVGNPGTFDYFTICVATEETTNVLVSLESTAQLFPRKFDGTNFSNFGTPLGIVGGSGRAATAMGNNSFAHIDATNDELRFYTMT